MHPRVCLATFLAYLTIKNYFKISDLKKGFALVMGDDHNDSDYRWEGHMVPYGKISTVSTFGDHVLQFKATGGCYV